MSDSTPLSRLASAAQELVDSITFDDCGSMVAGKWMGGNGGLISRDTIAKADAVRRAIAARDQR